MEKVVLVPLDGSPLAELALPHALEVAAATGSGLLLLQVLPQPVMVQTSGWPAGIATVEHEPDDGHRQIAAAYLKDIGWLLPANGTAVETRVATGDAAAAILECARNDERVILIAMGTHGRSGLNRLVYGSVAEKVLRAAPCPVLLVRGQEGEHATSDLTYRKIVVPLDGTSFSGEALTEATVLAQGTGAELLLVTVLPPDSEVLGEAGLVPYWLIDSRREVSDSLGTMLTAVEHALKRRGLKARTLVGSGQPASEILRICAEEQADIVVMATHGRNRLQQIWLGSVALEVVKGTSIPVLLVHPA